MKFIEFTRKSLLGGEEKEVQAMDPSHAEVYMNHMNTLFNDNYSSYRVLSCEEAKEVATNLLGSDFDRDKELTKLLKRCYGI